MIELLNSYLFSSLISPHILNYSVVFFKMRMGAYKSILVFCFHVLVHVRYGPSVMNWYLLEDDMLTCT